MTMSQWDIVWERARAGKHTVILGPADLPPAPDALLVLRVHCKAPWTTGGPLDEIAWYAANREKWLGRVDWLSTGAPLAQSSG